MAEGTGRGRGALLEMLKRKMEEEEAQARQQTAERSPPLPSLGRGRGSLAAVISAASLQSESTPTSAPSAGRGRASLLELMKPEGSVPSAPSLSVGRGRASLLSGFSQRSTTSTATTTSSGSSLPTTSGPVDVAGVTGPLSKISLEDTKSSIESEVVSRQGESGRPIELTANYINLSVKPGMGLNVYEVKFSPDIDSRPLRRKLLNQHQEFFGGTKNFDGALLYLPKRLEKDRNTLESEHPADGSKVQLFVIFKKTQGMHENVTFFNILISRVMRALELVRVGRKTFNPSCAHVVSQHRLEIWPGYVTAVNEYEGGLKLCVDSSHRVMRTDTVRDLIRDIYQKNPRNFRDAVTQEVLGTSVLTRYNNETYRIDDVAWDKSPKFEFERKGQKISLIDYYKVQWNLTIQDHEQPLLINRAKERTSTGQTQERMLLLIPEFCYLTGISDAMRSDFRIMKDIHGITSLNPTGRRDVIRKFVQKVKETEVTRELLAGWGLRLEDDTIKLTGRALDPETLIFGKGKTMSAGNKASWPAATKMPILRTPHLNSWVLLFDKRDERKCKEFVQMLKHVSSAVEMRVAEPTMIPLPNDRTESFLMKLREVMKSRDDIDMVVMVFPSIRQDRYSTVKKLCCVEMPVPSQVILSKTIGMDPKKARSAVEKIALQMNCKLGGALWALKVPFDKCMICGVDVYHAGVGKVTHGSVAGFVASMDKGLTSWYSKICIQARNQELVDLLKICLISAIKAYQKKNGFFPDRIFLYRDGVGDGQLDTVSNYEVKQLMSAFSMVEDNYCPRLTIVIVQKRINTRILAVNVSSLKSLKHQQGCYRDLGDVVDLEKLSNFAKRRELDNPPPGTIVDSDVTRRNFYDFFLVSQHVGRGTVSPTHYIVIHDSSNMKTDHLQRLTYKLCHLYYNWCGTVRVPAPCMYAHKLAYLVGQSLQTEPNESLAHNLYYL